jgi:hypothetical protein
MTFPGAVATACRGPHRLLGPGSPRRAGETDGRDDLVRAVEDGCGDGGDARGRLFTFEGDTRAARGGQARRGLSWSHDRVGGAASIDCSTEQIHDSGDHHILVGRAHRLDLVGVEEPLLFFRGGYGSFAPLSLASGEADLYEQLRAVDLARPQMESLARRFDSEVTAISLVRDELALVASAGRTKLAVAPTRVG